MQLPFGWPSKIFITIGCVVENPDSKDKRFLRCKQWFRQQHPDTALLAGINVEFDCLMPVGLREFTKIKCIFIYECRPIQKWGNPQPKSSSSWSYEKEWLG